MTDWLVPLFASAAGALVGIATTRHLVRSILNSAHAVGKAHTDEGHKLAQATQVRAREQSQELHSRLNRTRELNKERYQLELLEFEQDLDNRQQAVNARDTELLLTEQEIARRDQDLMQLRSDILQTQNSTHELQHHALVALENQSSVTRHQALQAFVQEAQAISEHEVQRRLQHAEAALLEIAPERAKRVMATAIERYDGVGHLERIQNTLVIEDATTFAHLAEPQKPSSIVFADAVKCELVADGSQQALTVRGDDPLAREIARRVIRILANRKDARPDTVRSVCADVKGEIEREVQNAGKKAARLLQLKSVHPEILHLVGRLKYRLSYSQNQWKHAVEVAQLAGIMAEELGLDVATARRGGLLHDIGKAMTHDHEGSHAVLGAEVARRCGEEEIVANAIGSHHNDEPMRTPIALVVTAADAISGARPGARRQSVTQYINLIDDLHRIVLRHQVVQRVDIMQAGREVRVFVAGQERGEVATEQRSQGAALLDHEIHPLAQTIAREIEEETAFAGQIRVTVIRESRATSVAR